MAGDDQRGRVYRHPLTDDVSPSRATYLAVAAAKDCDPLELPPLARTVSPDGLDLLADESVDGLGFTITFEYVGCSVTVTDEEVRVDVR